MQYDELKKLVLSRQSCRNFTGETVPPEKIEKILALARLAPSACNSQPWRIKAVTEPGMLKKVALALQDDNVNPYVSGAGAFLCLYPCEAVMKKRAKPKHPDDFFVPYDIGALSAYITLAAESLGVASLIVGWVNPAALDEATGYEGSGKCSIVIALGVSADPEIRTKIRKPMDEITF